MISNSKSKKLNTSFTAKIKLKIYSLITINHLLDKASQKYELKI